MNKLILSLWMASALVACGGGGGDLGPLTGSAAPGTVVAAVPALRARAAPAEAELTPQTVVLVNTTTAGDQRLRALGALDDGGYAVAWISGSTLFLQRYDSAGAKSGTETAIQLALDPRDTASVILARSSMAVLGDGSVVVAYAATRSSDGPTGAVVITEGLYLQRFDANGVQILPETELASFVQGDPRRPTTFQSVEVLGVEGGYVVAAGRFATSATLGSNRVFFTQRFDNLNQRVGGVVTIGGAISGEARLVADGQGGYTAYLSGQRPDFSPTGLSVTHYDATQSPTAILTGWPGSALLVPLQDGRYVLYIGDAAGVRRQVLDGAGAPVGDGTAIPAMPTAAQLLADGSHVVFWEGNDVVTAQRFDRAGAAVGTVLTIEAGGAMPASAALADGGLALAWSAAGAAGDLDVFTQRLVEGAAPDKAAVREMRRACRARAKGMTGHERKSVVDACMQGLRGRGAHSGSGG